MHCSAWLLVQMPLRWLEKWQGRLSRKRVLMWLWVLSSHAGMLVHSMHHLLIEQDMNGMPDVMIDCLPGGIECGVHLDLTCCAVTAQPMRRPYSV